MSAQDHVSDPQAVFDAALECVVDGIRLPSEVQLHPETLAALDAVAYAAHTGQPTDDSVAAARAAFVRFDN